MNSMRRISLQLTPLLDLLLIVMFAQYMEVRIAATQETERVADERDSIQKENESLQRQVDKWEADQRQLDRRQNQERVQIGQLIRELFRVPEVTINRIIQPRSKGDAAGLSPSEMEDLKARIQQLANARGEQVVDHLLTFNEMRKQFDLWEFYLNENGELLVTAGPDRQTAKLGVVESPEEFVDAVLQVRKQFPPTKKTVLILCRYGDCRLINKVAMVRGLPVIAERIQRDTEGTVRFEYAIFGYRPQAELEKR